MFIQKLIDLPINFNTVEGDIIIDTKIVIVKFVPAHIIYFYPVDDNTTQVELSNGTVETVLLPVNEVANRYYLSTQLFFNRS